MSTPQLNRTPLHVAASKGHTDIVKILLSHGGNVAAADGVRVQRVGHAWHAGTFGAAASSRYSAVSTQHVRATPLHLAALHGHMPVVLALLKHGAAVDAEDKVRRARCVVVARPPALNLPFHCSCTEHHCTMLPLKATLGCFESW